MFIQIAVMNHQYKYISINNAIKFVWFQDKDEQAFKHFQQVLRLAPDHKKAMEAYKKAKLLKQKKEEGNNINL